MSQKGLLTENQSVVPYTSNNSVTLFRIEFKTEIYW
jgi:hypothetical protein